MATVAIVRWRRRAFTLSHVSLCFSQSIQQPKGQMAPTANDLHCLPDGAGYGMFWKSQKTIILRRTDFLKLHDYALNHASLRDFCIIRVPMKCGLRPGEVRCLSWEQVDFETLTLNVVDSKKYETFPVPMDPMTADYLRQLRCKYTSKWVFPHDPESHTWKHWTNPLSYDAFTKIVKKLARLAGCVSWKKMTLYMLRHYFAANWAYPQDGKSPGNLHTLCNILRQSNIMVTHVYLRHFVFYEDEQAEYNRLQAGPFASNLQLQGQGGSSEFLERWCSRCDREATCRFVDQAVASPWADGCRYFKLKLIEKEEIKNNEN